MFRTQSAPQLSRPLEKWLSRGQLVPSQNNPARKRKQTEKGTKKSFSGRCRTNHVRQQSFQRAAFSGQSIAAACWLQPASWCSFFAAPKVAFSPQVAKLRG